MSVATEFPPAVYIPERARPATGGAPRHLALVPAPDRSAVVGPAPRRFGPAAAESARRFSDSRLDWPLTVTPAPAAAPLRLTRRGVLALVVATVFTGLVLLAVAWASAPGGTGAGTRAGAAGSVTVQPGDTLWSIAQRTAPQRDPRQVVDQLRRLNHLNSVALTPGQTLKLG